MMKLGLIGANGKMGKAVQSIYKEPLTLATKELPLEKIVTQADIWMDFSLNELAPDHINICEQHNKPLLIGTTGAHNLEAFEKHQTNIPILFAPNTSITFANIRKLLFALKSHQIVIGDTHFHTKKDKHSGTSMDVAGFMENVVGMFSFRNNINGAKMQFELSNMDEMISINFTSCNRAPYAKGAIEATEWLIKQAPGIYSMQNFIS